MANEPQELSIPISVSVRGVMDRTTLFASRRRAYFLAQYDRKRLYEEVWSEPTQKVARSYGISDVALSKVCRQLQIPKPPRGYWAKKQAGRPVSRRPKLAPLPRQIIKPLAS